MSDHKCYGEYNIHLYYVQDDGKLVGAGGIKTNVSLGQRATSEPKIRIMSTAVLMLDFKRFCPFYEVSVVSVPVWSGS